jgi:hypothetical protein
MVGGAHEPVTSVGARLRLLTVSEFGGPRAVAFWNVLSRQPLLSSSPYAISRTWP